MKNTLLIIAGVVALYLFSKNTEKAKKEPLPPIQQPIYKVKTDQ